MGKDHKFLVDLPLQKVYGELKQLLKEYAPNSGKGIGPIVLFSTVLVFLQCNQ
jgi:hypothetical protein